MAEARNSKEGHVTKVGDLMGFMLGARSRPSGGLLKARSASVAHGELFMNILMLLL
jgi:hypothetical protein